MLEAELKALLLLAGIESSSNHKLENQYWPDNPHYDEVRRENPWWLVVTKAGPITIGRRKRVWQIGWSDTKIRKKMTEDPVTNEDHYVHAYTMPKLLQYLMELGREIRRETPVKQTESVVDA